MFDKLGDLLSEALEKGELPKANEDSPDFFQQQEESPKEEEKASQETKRDIPAIVKSALDFIGISEEADFDSAKKIYREKLMYYHPDRRNSNPVLQKVAKEKTERLLREWKILEKWYEQA